MAYSDSTGILVENIPSSHQGSNYEDAVIGKDIYCMNFNHLRNAIFFKKNLTLKKKLKLSSLKIKTLENG